MRRSRAGGAAMTGPSGAGTRGARSHSRSASQWRLASGRNVRGHEHQPLDDNPSSGDVPRRRRVARSLSAMPHRGRRSMNKGFLKAGPLPTLFAAFLYFDLTFMAWVMLGPLGVQIAKDLGLGAAERGLMVATPVLAGAVIREINGVLVGHLKPR